MRASASLLALVLAARAAALDEEVAVGMPAPSFSLKTMNPEACGASWVVLDRLVGAEAEDPGAKAVLISFFASWCEPCKKELPFLVQLDRTYRGQGLRVLAVSIDREEPGVEAAKRMIAQASVAYPVLSDRFNFLARRYLGDKAPLPSVFIVRRDGTIAKISRGYTRDATQFLLADVQDALGVAPHQQGGKVPAAAGPPSRAGGRR